MKQSWFLICVSSLSYTVEVVEENMRFTLHDISYFPFLYLYFLFMCD